MPSFTDEELGIGVATFSDEDLGIEVGAVQTAEERGVTPSFQFASEGINRFTDALLGLPDFALTAAAQLPSPVNIVRNAFNPASTPDQIANTSLLEDATGIQPPEVGSRVLPIPRAEEIRAGVSSALDIGSPLDAGQAFDLARAEQEQRKQEFPLSTTAGQVAGDVATIATGRSPVARASAVKQMALPGTAVAKFVGPGFKRAINDVFKSKSVTGLGRAARKATSAGVEGATISILQGGDPLETAAFSAGGQTVGSLALKLGTTGKGVLGVAGAALAAGSILQLFDAATPGGKDFILPNIEAGYDKVLFAVTTGVLAGMAGAGRLRGRGFENFPALVDGITTFPRVALISLLNDNLKDTDGRMNATISTLAEDPELFTAQERARLSRAMKSGDVSMLDTINDMAKIKAFRKKIEEIVPQEQPPTLS